MKKIFALFVVFAALLLWSAIAFAADVVAPMAAPVPTFWVTLTSIFATLWAVSEALAQIPAVKGNSIFQVISNLLAKIGAPKGGA